MRRAALTLAALLLSGPAVAQHPHHGASGGQDERPALGASAAFGPSGRLWAVHAESGHVVLSVSPDAGGHWSRLGPVNRRPEAIAATGDNRPKIAVGQDGRLLVSWTQPLDRPYTGMIRLATAPAGSVAFSPPLTVHRDRQVITHRFDALTVARDGKIIISWIDKRDRERARASGGGYRGAAVYYAVSRDGGQHFEPEQHLAAHSCECCRIALAARRDGSVQALWRHVFSPNIRDHATARIAADGSPGPLLRATRDDWALDACPHHGPSMAEGADGTLHAVWFTGAEGRAGPWYGQLTDDGMTRMVALPDAGAAHADVATSGNAVVVVWKVFDGEATRLRAMRSDDRGHSWQPPRTLARVSDASGQPFVLVRDGRFHAFWHSRAVPLGTWEIP